MVIDRLSELLPQLDASYQRSDIRQFAFENDVQWYYSLIIGRLLPNSPLLLGFNWGAANGKIYRPQTELLSENYTNIALGSFSRVQRFLRKYMNEYSIQNVSQSNYCFFRSKKEEQITANDILLCEGIFNKMIAILRPSVVVVLSSKLKEYMINNALITNLQHKTLEYSRGGKTNRFVVKKGELCLGSRIVFLPHPNYPMSGKAREEAWEYCFNNG